MPGSGGVTSSSYGLGRVQAAESARPTPPILACGRYLAPWLAAHDDEAVAGQLPHSGGLAVQTDLHREVTTSVR
jgi:hypothetical protein